MAKSKEIAKVADKEVKVTTKSVVITPAVTPEETNVVLAGVAKIKSAIIEPVMEVKVTAEQNFGENKFIDKDIVDESVRVNKLKFKAITDLELDKVLSFKMPSYGSSRKRRLNGNEKSSKLIIDGVTIEPIVSDIEMSMDFYGLAAMFGVFENLVDSKNARAKYEPKNAAALKCSFDLYVYSVIIPSSRHDTGSSLVDSLKQKIEGDQKVAYQILLMDNESSMTIDTENHNKWNFSECNLLSGHTANVMWAINSQLSNTVFKGNNSVEQQKVEKCLLVNSCLRLPKDKNLRFGPTVHTVKNLNILNSMVFGCDIESTKNQGTIKNSTLERVNVSTNRLLVIGSNITNFNYFNYQGSLKSFTIENSSLKGFSVNSDVKSLEVKNTCYRSQDNGIVYLNGPYEFDIQSMFDINVFRVTDDQDIIAIRSTEGFVLRSNYTASDKIFVYKPDDGLGNNRPYNTGVPRPFMPPAPVSYRPANDFYTLRMRIIESLNIELFKGKIQGTVADQILDDVVSTIGRRFDISEHARQIQLMLPRENRFARGEDSICYPYDQDGFDF